MKKAALLVLALAALTLTACGGGGDNESSSSTTTGGGAESNAAAEGGGEAPAGSVVSIEAAPGSEIAYTTDKATAKAGQVSIKFTNPQQLTHDVVVEDSQGKTVGETELIADTTTTTTIPKLKPGSYTFYCSVPGHREAGMEGTLTVK
jgi:plastocyanin